MKINISRHEHHVDPDLCEIVVVSMFFFVSAFMFLSLPSCGCVLFKGNSWSVSLSYMDFELCLFL